MNKMDKKLDTKKFTITNNDRNTFFGVVMGLAAGYIADGNWFTVLTIPFAFLLITAIMNKLIGTDAFNYKKKK